MAQVPSETTRTVSSSASATPAPAGRAFAFATLALVSSLGLTGVFHNNAAHRFTGRLQAETTVVSASHRGKVAAIHATSGMVLNSVERLVVLTDEKLDAELAAVEREVATLQAEVDRVRAKAEVELAIRLKELDAEIFSARLRSTGYLKEQYFNEVEGLAWRDLADDINPLGTASQTNDVFQSLVFQGSMTDETRIRSLLRREAAHNAAEVNAAQVKICEQRMQGLEDLKRELARKIRHAEGIEVAEARLAQATEKLERLRQAQATLTLNGVAYRTVGVFRKNVGEQVASGETIVELLDNDRRFLIVDLPTRAVPEFPAESNVRLQFPGGQKCTGRVREIPPQTAAQASFNRARHNGDAAAFEEVVTLRIDPTGKLWPDVPIGTAVEVSPGE